MKGRWKQSGKQEAGSKKHEGTLEAKREAGSEAEAGSGTWKAGSAGKQGVGRSKKWERKVGREMQRRK
jgi:hypothetical protein